MLTVTTLEARVDTNAATVGSRRSSLVAGLWRGSPPLTAAGLGMLVVLVASLAGLALDTRVITGAPAWLKPAKFAISTAIYALTVAWILTYVQERARLVRVVGWGTALVLVLEVALIDVQAARGTTSHFNVGTPLDAVIFATMGVAILLAWGLAIALTVALFRQTFTDRALGWALRLGMLITVLGSGMGGLMTRPTAAQLATARVTHSLPVAGAHTVGAPDGGRGLPGTAWSRQHGDLRVPHFVGLHAIQIVPLAVLLIGARLTSARRRERAALVVSASYAMLFAMLIVQALAGESVVAPSVTTLSALGVWLVGSIATIAYVTSTRGIEAAHSLA
jgi:hypothetical protein